jgi:hypothetical protein
MPNTRRRQSISQMPQTHALPASEDGRSQFQCLDRAGDDPLRSPEVAKLLTGELRPLE